MTAPFTGSTPLEADALCNHLEGEKPMSRDDIEHAWFLLGHGHRMLQEGRKPSPKLAAASWQNRWN